MNTRRLHWIGRIVLYGGLVGFIWISFSTVLCCKKSMHGRDLGSKIQMEIQNLKDNLKWHVEILAERIGERNLFKPQKLQEASDYIQESWQKMGFEVFKHTYELEGITCETPWIQIEGKKYPDQIILIGAHYDSVLDSPGADDNASGVGALLEISNALTKEEFSRSIRFVAFVNEEPPFFQTEKMGSTVYAQGVAEKRENIVAMISLETIGYFSNEPKSQRYPGFMRWFYPDRGNFIGIVGNLGSRKLVKKVTRLFQEETNFPIECISAPRALPGVDWSDQASFWDHGYQAVMITDTALYRYPHYHLPSDSPHQLNYESYAQVVDGLIRVIRRLANE